MMCVFQVALQSQMRQPLPTMFPGPFIALYERVPIGPDDILQRQRQLEHARQAALLVADKGKRQGELVCRLNRQLQDLATHNKKVLIPVFFLHW